MSCKPRMTASARRGLRTVWAFCDAHSYDDSELFPRDDTKQRRKDTEAALAWIDRASSVEEAIK